MKLFLFLFFGLIAVVLLTAAWSFRDFPVIAIIGFWIGSSAALKSLTALIDSFTAPTAVDDLMDSFKRAKNKFDDL